MTSAILAFLLVALVGGILLLAVVFRPQTRSRGGGPRRGPGSAPTLNRAQTIERWSVIEAMAAGGGNGLRQAVSEADKLLDNALRASGAHGNTLGERLKSAKPKFTNYATYDAAWRAHKLRNALAHEVGFDLVPSQAREALSDFKRAITDLGAM